MVVNWAYIAGFFDGEGNVGVYGRTPAVTMTQTNEVVLRKIQGFLGTVGIKSSMYGYKPYRSSTHNFVWKLSIRSKESTEKFLHGVIPYLCVKKVVAQDVQRFVQLYPKMTPQQRTSVKAGHYV